jgi:hypothetical protein
VIRRITQILTRIARSLVSPPDARARVEGIAEGPARAAPLNEFPAIGWELVVEGFNRNGEIEELLYDRQLPDFKLRHSEEAVLIRGNGLDLRYLIPIEREGAGVPDSIFALLKSRGVVPNLRRTPWLGCRQWTILPGQRLQILGELRREPDPENVAGYREMGSRLVLQSAAPDRPAFALAVK